jgi:hypothetical protein
VSGTIGNWLGVHVVAQAVIFSIQGGCYGITPAAYQVSNGLEVRIGF